MKVTGTAWLTTKIKMATLREPLQIFAVLLFLEIPDIKDWSDDCSEHENTFGEAGRRFLALACEPGFNPGWTELG